MKRREVITVFIEHGGKVLILRRSHRVSTYQGRWAGISGSIEKSPDEQALSEMREEAGLGPDDVRLIRKGEPLEVADEEKGILWVVYPYLFHVVQPDKIRLDWEHVEMRWIKPEEMEQMETVPGLIQTLARVWGGGNSHF